MFLSQFINSFARTKVAGTVNIFLKFPQLIVELINYDLTSSYSQYHSCLMNKQKTIKIH